MKFANYYYRGGVDMKYERILVAVDGSPVAERAAVFAADIAESLGAVMALLYISCFLQKTTRQTKLRCGWFLLFILILT